LPAGVISRAREILGGLERDELSRGGRPTLSGSSGDPHSPQLALFGRPADSEADLSASAKTSADRQGRLADNELAKRLREVDVNETTPRQALELLADLKKLAE